MPAPRVGLCGAADPAADAVEHRRVRTVHGHLGMDAERGRGGLPWGTRPHSPKHSQTLESNGGVQSPFVQYTSFETPLDSYSAAPVTL